MAAADVRPSGLVTLLTDFGVDDTFVGVMKGVLHGRSPSLRAVIDLTHEIAPQDVEEAADQLAEAWRWFPPGTVHIAVVDPGVGSSRAVLAARREQHVFLAPDNGLLSRVLAIDDEVRELDVRRFALADASRTFHGRDVFAPAAAAWVEGLSFAALGPLARDWRRLTASAPVRLGGGRLAGRVRRVDHFGNLITDIDRATVAELVSARGVAATLRVRIGDHELPLVATYADVPPGRLAALINSSGLVEVARRDGDAARHLGLGRGAELHLEIEP